MSQRGFLRSAGYLGASTVVPDQLTPVQATVQDWSSWMRDQRGLTAKTEVVPTLVELEVAVPRPRLAVR